MNFRTRLLLFFVIIVVIPMVAVAVVLFSITEDNETGKADAELATGLRVAQSLYNDDRLRARTEAGEVAQDPEVGRALRAGDAEGLRNRLQEFMAQRPEIKAI